MPGRITAWIGALFVAVCASTPGGAEDTAPSGAVVRFVAQYEELSGSKEDTSSLEVTFFGAKPTEKQVEDVLRSCVTVHGVKTLQNKGF